MRPEPETPHDLLDRMLRKTLADPANLQAFLRAAVPHLADRFDCARASAETRDFLIRDWRGREADLPFVIPFRDGDGEALVFVLIEHQSRTEPLVLLRMLAILVAFWDRQWQDWKVLPPPKTALRLRPVLPLCCTRGRHRGAARPPWRS